MKMTIIEALEEMDRLNDYEEILVQTNAGEPTLIFNEIDNINNFADDPTEIFDLQVTASSIREIDDSGYIVSGEPLYKRVEEVKK